MPLLGARRQCNSERKSYGYFLPDIFIWLTRLIETAIALCLLFGFARKTLYVVGALFSLFRCWGSRVRQPR